MHFRSFHSSFPNHYSLFIAMAKVVYCQTRGAPPVLADFHKEHIVMEEGCVFTWSDDLQYTLDHSTGIFVVVGESKRKCPGWGVLFDDEDDMDKGIGSGGTVGETEADKGSGGTGDDMYKTYRKVPRQTDS